ncbi:MAG: Gx transporter family protein [Eubacteriales bacterium]|nr:Gx transporter family protein [Eubacteriales bacterium]
MKKLNKLTLNAMLSALAVAVSAVEGLLPAAAFMPPGAKIGLSNIVTMYASKTLTVYNALAIVVVKSVFVLATRGATAFFMSFLGGAASTIITAALLNSKKSKYGTVGIGVLGAAAHNCSQLLVAVIITNEGVLYYLPFLIAASVVTGTFTGVILHLTLSITSRRSE